MKSSVKYKALKVLHLVPYDGIGGVETAARSMGRLKQGNILFEVGFIYKQVSHAKQRWQTFNPIPLFSTAWTIAQGKTDLLIVSLWRSAIVGVLAKLLNRKLKLVVFIHLAVDVHWLDFIFNRLAILLATEVWADSRASLRQRLPRLDQKKCRVISFVTRRFDVLPIQSVSPDFIFWGRINAQKGLGRALRLFAEIYKHRVDARFWIIGPDGGQRQEIEQLCESLSLKEGVSFLGSKNMGEISVYASSAAFYLQTSLAEGMAMSVVEAMQMGLVPVVTPVGEIASYCIHDNNALIVESDQDVVDELLALMGDDAKYQKLRVNAALTWDGALLYKESVLGACEALLNPLEASSC